MEKLLEQQILDSASTGGSTSSIGAQILEKGIGRLNVSPTEEAIKTPAEITAENDALIVKAMEDILKPEEKAPETSTSPRGGRGTQADSSKLGPAIENALKTEAPAATIDPALIEKARKEKERILTDLADLRVRERQAENLSQETKDLITENIRATYKKLSTVNLNIPDADPQEDAAKVRRVIAEYDEEARIANAKKAEVAQEVVPEEVPPVIPTEVAPVEPEPLSLVQDEQEAPKTPVEEPVQNAYSSAMDRIWEENEAKRKAMSMVGKGENLALEPLAVEAAAPEATSLPTPVGVEGPHLGGSDLVKQGSTTIEGYFTRILEDKTSTEQGTELALTAEQLKQIKLERIRTKLDAMTGAVEARAEKVGMVDNIRKIGAMWNKVPKRYKYLLAGGALLSGVGAAAAGSAVAMGTVGALGTALRGLSGAGLFVTFETILKNAHEKKTGGERSKATESRHMLIASLGAVAFAALLPKMISEYMGSEALHAGTHGAGATAIETPVAPAPAQHIEYVVGKGGTLWGGIEEQLNAKGLLSNMHGGQKTYMIDAIKDKFAAMSPSELKAIGITSGRIDLIHPGDHIDLTKVLGDTSTMHEVVQHAQGLSPEQIYSIEHPPVAHPAGAEMVTPTPAADHAAFPGSTPETTSAMPSEIAPMDPALVAASDKVVHDYVDSTFGSKGILGFGAQDGMDSIDWKDPDVGFANQPVDKVLSAHPSAFPADGARHFGVEDYSATQKMQAGLAEAQKETGVTARPAEKVADYLKRAALSALSQEPTVTTPTTLRT